MDGEEKEDTSRTVFTDVSLKLTIKQVSYTLPPHTPTHTYTYMYMYTVEPPNKGHLGKNKCPLFRGVLYSEVRNYEANVFETVSLLFQIAVKLSQVEGVEGGELRPLLDVVISNMKADVVDRKWDSQGSVAMGEISILDYITPGRSCTQRNITCVNCRTICKVPKARNLYDNLYVEYVHVFLSLQPVYTSN